MKIITGTSSGIGKALAEHYLAKGERVIGISRSNTLQDALFTHIPCDLSNIKELEQLELKKHITQQDFPISLFNNAGTIGDINRSHELSLSHYTQVANLNIVAPQYLSTLVLQTFGFENVSFILNISSGAGQRPIPSWAAYCASKAAIDLFSRTLQEEILELGYSTRIFSVAPGVVDTQMQVTIRQSGEENFSQNKKFVELKEENMLRSPEEVAQLLTELLANMPSLEEGVVLRV